MNTFLISFRLSVKAQNILSSLVFLRFVTTKEGVDLHKELVNAIIVDDSKQPGRVRGFFFFFFASSWILVVRSQRTQSLSNGYRLLFLFRNHHSFQHLF